ncbi:MAG: hypothetical protein NZ811_00725 [Gammaproteobacteria bacterium]|nr:hypothetical protein [Gammaproteobacteria bacterium]
MSLKTRLDGRSGDNNLLLLKDRDGNILAEVKVLDNQSVTLEVSTRHENYVEKNNGWSSIKYKGA